MLFNTNKAKLSLVVAFSAGLAVVTGSGAAFAIANPLTCAPNIVEVNNTNLLIQCAPTNFYVALNASGYCSAYLQTMDVIKMWQTLADAALLSGKSLNIYWSQAGSIYCPTTIDLVR